jgi:hypothetical protein
MANTQIAAKTKIAKKINSLSNLEMDSSQSMFDNVRENIINQYEDLKDQVSDVTETSISFVKKYPLYTLAGALAIGVVTAMVIRGRKE